MDPKTMMQFMNMMNMMKGSAPTLPDPKKMDPRVKKNIINQNINQSKIGLYKKYPNFNPITCQLIQNFNPGLPDKLCDVKVVHEHVIDVAEKYAEKGLNFTSTNNMNPVILNTVGKEFSGTNFESSVDIRDQIINMRTSFNNTVGTNSPYPTKDSDCVFSKSVTVIRSKNIVNGGFLPYNQTFRVAMITTTPIACTEFLSNNKMTSTDYLKTLSIIECVFQTAIAGKHPILILCPFGHDEDQNPIDDIIRIYNYCILKYSHRFKEIIIGVPPFYPVSVFEIYGKKILKPLDMVQSVDAKYDQEQMKQNLLAPKVVNVKFGSNSSFNSNSNSSKNDQQLQQMMQMMMNMMKPK